MMSTLKADSDGKTASSLLFTNGCSHQSYRPLVRPEQLFQIIHLFSILFSIFFSISTINIIMTGKVFVEREWLRKPNISGRHLTGCLKVLVGFAEIFLRPEI